MLLGATGGAAVDLNDVADLGYVHKLIDEPLTVHLGEDAALIVVPATENQSINENAAMIVVPAPESQSINENAAMFEVRALENQSINENAAMVVVHAPENIH